MNSVIGNKKMLSANPSDSPLLADFGKMMLDLKDKFCIFLEKGDGLDEIIALVTRIHEQIKTIEFGAENGKYQNFYEDTFFVKILLDIFANEHISDEPKQRCVKILTIMIHTNKSAYSEFEKLTPVLDFFSQFYESGNPLLPPTCLSLLTLVLMHCKENSEKIKEMHIFERSLDILDAMRPAEGAEVGDQAKTMICILYKIISGLISVVPPEEALASIERIVELSGVFFNIHESQVYETIICCLCQLSSLEFEHNTEENVSHIINNAGMLDFLVSVLSNPECVNCYNNIVILFIYNFPFDGEMPLERLIELLGTQNSITKHIFILFKKLITKNEEVPEVFYSTEFVDKVTEIPEHLNASVVIYAAEFILVVLTFSPIETIQALLENESLGDIIISAFEIEHAEFKNLVGQFMNFLKKMTLQGIPEDGPLKCFIEALKEPISEKCDSDDGEIRIYASTLLKNYYPDEYNSKYYTDNCEEHIIIKLSHD